MNIIQNQGQVVANTFNDLLSRFISFLPGLIGAIVILIIGIIIAAILAKVVEKIIVALRVDHVIATAQHEVQGRPGHEIKASVVLREIVRWFFILVFAVAASEVLGLSQLSTFLDRIILYIPNVIVAVLILSVTLIIAKYVSQFVMESEAVAASSFQSHVIAAVAKWAIIIFGISAVLIQLGIAASLVDIIFVGIVGAFALAMGIAFGLGGKEEAALIWKKMREGMRGK